mmetsp:Transcript_26032/g.60433  ORF Transcript_26032/g.60433 Transcript_26032/m.60433 type:complete len:281 (-) Transcript_26032:263-1105(-)
MGTSGSLGSFKEFAMYRSHSSSVKKFSTEITIGSMCRSRNSEKGGNRKMGRSAYWDGPGSGPLSGFFGVLNISGVSPDEAASTSARVPSWAVMVGNPLRLGSIFVPCSAPTDSKSLNFGISPASVCSVVVDSKLPKSGLALLSCVVPDESRSLSFDPSTFASIDSLGTRFVFSCCTSENKSLLICDPDSSSIFASVDAGSPRTGLSFVSKVDKSLSFVPVSPAVFNMSPKLFDTSSFSPSEDNRSPKFTKEVFPPSLSSALATGSTISSSSPKSSTTACR